MKWLDFLSPRTEPPHPEAAPDIDAAVARRDALRKRLLSVEADMIEHANERQDETHPTPHHRKDDAK